MKNTPQNKPCREFLIFSPDGRGRDRVSFQFDFFTFLTREPGERLDRRLNKPIGAGPAFGR